MSLRSFYLDTKRTKKSNQSEEIAKTSFAFETSRLMLRIAITFLLSLFLQIDDSDLCPNSGVDFLL